METIAGMYIDTENPMKAEASGSQFQKELSMKAVNKVFKFFGYVAVYDTFLNCYFMSLRSGSLLSIVCAEHCYEASRNYRKVLVDLSDSNSYCCHILYNRCYRWIKKADSKRQYKKGSFKPLFPF